MTDADRRVLEQFLAAQLEALGPERFQQFLEDNLQQCLLRMGIGSGADCRTSGEKQVLELLVARSIKDRPICIFDVGANTGQYLRELKHCLGARAHQLHVFEPSRTAFQSLLAAYAEDPAVKLNNCALSAEKGAKELFFNTSGSALASFYKRRLDHFGISFEGSECVPVRTLDDYCRTNSVEQVDLLKLDVEGHEFQVLQGGRQMIAAGRVAMITFEFGGCDIDSRTYFQDFYYFFTQHHMRLSRITPSGVLVPLPHYHEHYEQFMTSNFLAVRE
jgi:FkbM family methyltransferase